MRSLFFLLLLLIPFLGIHEVKATHIVGGELSYRCIGDKAYEFTLSIYTDCGSAIVLDPTYFIQYYSTSQGIPLSEARLFEVTKNIVEEEVSLYCDDPSIITTCSGGAFPGVKRVNYTGTITLDDFATDWIFFWQRSARNESINTLVLPDAEDYFTQLTMNNLAVPCNSSPTFESNPVINVCIGNETVFGNAALDNEGDQLVFKLAAPKSSSGVDVTYKDGFDFLNFISLVAPAEINANSGDITFTAANMQLTGITDILVEEYRDGELIGTVTRGLQVTSVPCLNAPPEISDFVGIDVSEVTVCAGDTIDLEFSAVDLIDNDVLNLELLSGNTAVFEILANDTVNPQARIFWETTQDDAGTYLFSVQADDGFCPEPGVANKTFVIEILSTPQVEFPDDVIISCDTLVTLTPTISGGTEPFTFNWNTSATTPSITEGIGEYSLNVLDAEGCVGVDSVALLPSLVAFFKVDKRCDGEPVIFRDSSVSTLTNIQSYFWDFGDGATSTLQNPTHLYATAGDYIVSLTVTDDETPTACTSVYNDTVTVCPPLVIDITPDLSCSNTVDIFRVTPDFLEEDACRIDSVDVDFGDGFVERFLFTEGDSVTHFYAAGGTYTIEVTAFTAAGCVQSFSKSVEIRQSPRISIDQKINNSILYIDCANPLTELTTTLIPGDGTSHTYEWNSSLGSDRLSVNPVFRNSRDSLSFLVRVTDDNGCFSTDFIIIGYPLQAEFYFDAFCDEGDGRQFSDSTFHVNNIDSWQWDFGDGTSSMLEVPPLKTYSTSGRYLAKLVVEDDIGCKDSITQNVFYTFLDDDRFEILPDDISVCVRDSVFAFGPGTDPSGVNHIQSWSWDFNNDDLSDKQDDVTFYFSQSVFDGEIRTYFDTLTVFYNATEDLNEGCVRKYADTVRVFPELNAAISTVRVCKDFSSEFTFERTAGDTTIQVVDALWDYGDGSGDIDNTLSGEHTYTATGKYTVTLDIEDALGCTKKIEREFLAETVADPDFNPIGIVCANEPSSFEFEFDKPPENITQYQWIFNGIDTLSGKWVSPLPTTFSRVLGRDTTHEVTLMVLNEFSKCEKSITKNVSALEIPLANFEIDTLCTNEIGTFRNLTSGDSEITGYRWLFHDDTASEEFEPSKAYPEAGTYPVTLVAFNALNCSDTIRKEVVVRPAPVARFSTADPFVEAFIATQFFNESEGEDIVAFDWAFGDGATATDENPTHTYDTIKVYFPRLIVTNGLGCMDTVVVRTDLNVRLDLPTGFSPNNDGENDELGLVHNGIKTLYEYKIYNRWGQLVFDGGGDVNKTWDGTVNGARQERGVYIALVKAKGAYDIDFNFKKNITLLR